MRTARTGTCVRSHVTEVSEMMGWQYVMKVLVIGSWNWLTFAKDHQNTVQWWCIVKNTVVWLVFCNGAAMLIVHKLSLSQEYKLYGLCYLGGCVASDISRDRDAFIFKDCLTCKDEVNLIFWKIRNHKPNETVSHHRRPESSASLLWEPHISYLMHPIVAH